MSIIATSKATNANSFATEAEADAYHEGRLNNAEWAAASAGDKEKALRQATTILNMMKWQGTPTTTSQALKFPRYGLYTTDEIYVDADTIPQDLIKATAEFAWLLIIGDTQRESSNKGIKSVGAGPVNVVFDGERSKKTVPSTVIEFISHWLESYGSVEMQRG